MGEHPQKESLDLVRCLLSPDLAIFGVAWDCQPDIVIYKGLAQAARGHPKANPIDPCDHSHSVRQSQMFNEHTVYMVCMIAKHIYYRTVE